MRSCGISRDFSLLSPCVWQVIHGLNKYLGLAAGGALALLITWIFFFVLVMFIGNDLADGLLSDIKASKVLTFLFDSDILFQMF